jgi:RNA polymerase sigma-70 factor (ECF subfamily)
MEPAWINAEPGMLNFDADGRLINVFVLEISDGLVQAVHSSINPDKLNHLGDPLSELGLRTAD